MKETTWKSEGTIAAPYEQEKDKREEEEKIPMQLALRYYKH